MTTSYNWEDEQPKDALRILVPFGNSRHLMIPGYRLLESSEMRYSLSGVSMFLGQDPTWLSHLSLRGGLTFQRLKALGLTMALVPVRFKFGNVGTRHAMTISGDDVDVLVHYQASRGSKRAGTILQACFAEVRKDRERHAGVS